MMMSRQYKKTKIGFLPEDWECLSFSDVFERVSNKVLIKPNSTYREIGIRSHGKGIFHKPIISGKSIGNKRVFHVQNGALVFNIVFAWEQAVGIISEKENGFIASHRFPMYIGRKNKAFEPFFLIFFLTPIGKYLLNIASPGGAGRNKTLGQKELDELKIPVPQFEEQKKIYEIINTWDDSIKKLQDLKRSKELRKIGLMQQLLSGRKRLPGFGAETKNDKEIPSGWKPFLIREISDVFFSNVDKKTYTDQRKVFLCNYKDVYKNNYITNKISFMESTASNTEIEKFLLQKNDVIITKDSESSEDIGVPTVVIEDLKNVVCGYHLAIIRPNINIVDSIFLTQKLKEPYTRYKLSTLANGATRFGLSTSAIKNLKVILPGILEQKAISDVLFQQDDEIEALNRQIELYRNQKKGLMQKLLTGEVRVKL
jgi:type I restriction enzyme S subunit